MSRISGSEARGLREAYANIHNNMNKKRSEELRESFFSWLEENKDIIPEGVSLDIKELYAVYLLDKGYISEQPVLSPRERSGVGVMRSRSAAPVVRPGQPVAAAPSAKPASGQPAVTSSSGQAPQFSSSTINPPRMVAQPQSVEIARRVGSYTGTAGVGYANATNVKPVGTPLPANAVKPVPGAPTQNATVVKPMTAMDKWKAANPKLAAAAAERERIRGTAQTDNPLMRDMKSRLPLNSPSIQSPDVEKLGKGNQSLVSNPNAFKGAPQKPAATSTSTQSSPTTTTQKPGNGGYSTREGDGKPRRPGEELWGGTQKPEDVKDTPTTPVKKEPPKKPPLRDEPLW